MTGSINGDGLADDELEPIVHPPEGDDRPERNGRPWRLLVVIVAAAVVVGFLLLRPAHEEVDKACNTADLFEPEHANVIVTLGPVDDDDLEGVLGALRNRAFDVDEIMVRRGDDGPTSRVAHVRLGPGAGATDLDVFLDNAELVPHVEEVAVGPCPVDASR